jgi:hypothetical protein
MKKTLSTSILAIVVLFAISCGKKGPIYPPLVNVPKPIEELSAFQRGANIVLSWNNPTMYIDGSELEEITRVDIWLLITSDEAAPDKEEEQEVAEEVVPEEAEEESQDEAEQDEGEQRIDPMTVSAESFPEDADFVASIAQELFSDYRNETQEQSLTGEFVCFYPISPEDFEGKTYTFALKVWSKKKESDFSALISVKPKALPHPPAGLTTEVFEDKIQIEWTPPGKNIDDSSPVEVKGYNVYRKSEEEGKHLVNTGLILDTTFSDSEFQFDEKYTYYVRASVSESSPFLESADSEPLEIVPKDTFPPKMPKGLVAVPGDDFVSLSWDINRESDLAGYKVWRKSSTDEKFTALGELIRDNVYNDTTVRRDKRYEYSVSAVDKSGNESEKSKSISVVPGRGLT